MGFREFGFVHHSTAAERPTRAALPFFTATSPHRWDLPTGAYHQYQFHLHPWNSSHFHHRDSLPAGGRERKEMPRPLEIFTPRPYFPLSVAKPNPNPSSHSFLPTKCALSGWSLGCHSFSHFISRQTPYYTQKKPPFSLVASAKPFPDREGSPNTPPKKKRSRRKPEENQESGSADISSEIFPSTIPRKPRRGRRSEAVEVEDFIRNSLERTFTSIRKQNSEVLEGKEEILKERNGDESDGEEGSHGGVETEKVVEEEDPDWPVDAEVGWGVRASDYFNKHPIKNVVVDGLEIDWEGEVDEGWVKEINCLEWESFAFHPSPLIVLVFERYNRASDNWKLLQELEKATKVYWNAKDRLPPRTVKIDMNIETDLAYALKVQECPQLLFLQGNRVLYREKEIRTADELVHMIAHFYYNAKKPSWIDDATVGPPY